MSKFLLPFFNEIDSDSVEEYYDVKTDLNGRSIDLDLNFEETKIPVERLELLKKFLDRLGDCDQLGLDAISEDYPDGETVPLYIKHHLEQVDKAQLAGLVDFSSSSLTPEEQLLTRIQLVRAGFYPADKDNFATFDYSIGRELTNYLVVINFNDRGEVDHITMES